MCLPAPRAVRPIETAGAPHGRRIAPANTAARPGPAAGGLAAVRVSTHTGCAVSSTCAMRSAG